WARGNSWVVASLADYLRIAVESGEPDPAVQAIFEKHVAAILSAQDETGMWQTVMSHPEEPGNYLETSGTALFAYGIARAWRYGLLSDEDRRAAQKAAAYIQQNRIVDDIVTGVSGATDPWPLRDPDGFGAGYLDVPLEDDKDYGVGAMILALIETSGLPE
ncbi:MAG: glycoside hydrolase family 88 protein, partial [Myxococcales bacterium]